jgi:tRNA(adenine34) deaminase
LDDVTENLIHLDRNCWAPEDRYMRWALREAHRAAQAGEVPVGAVIVYGDRLIGKAHNQVETLHDPTAHAEILALTQAAAALGDWRLLDTVMYVTKEPCPMCAGAIIQARVPMVVWGMTDPKRGGAASLFNMFDNPALNHRVTFLAGFLEDEAKGIMQEFFKERR